MVFSFFRPVTASRALVREATTYLHAPEDRFPVDFRPVRKLMVFMFHPFKNIRAGDRKGFVRKNKTAFGALHGILFIRQKGNAVFLPAFRTEVPLSFRRIVIARQCHGGSGKIDEAFDPFRRAEIESCGKSSKLHTPVVLGHALLLLIPKFIDNPEISVRLPVLELLPRETRMILNRPSP